MNRLRQARSDEGTIGILTLGFTVLALMLILVISAATSVHLTRLRLTHLADELAEDAADAADTGGYFGDLGGFASGPCPRDVGHDRGGARARRANVASISWTGCR